VAGPGHVVVVGASLAGVHAAAALRRGGHDGAITIIDAQSHHPYDRPPLSKELLSGRFGVDDIPIRSADGLEVDWMLGTTATGLRLNAQASDGSGGAAGGEGAGGEVVCGDTTVAFDSLVIACGASARTLPGTSGLDAVQTLRTLDDALALRQALDDGLGSLVVVGAGFIGLEVAATCRQRSVEVTVVETAAQPLSRVLGDEVGAAIGRIHRNHGVDLRLGVGVDGVAAHADGVSLALDDDSEVVAGRAVVGIGVIPDTAWLEGSGLTLDNGVVCDATLSAAPGVVAAGDLLRWPSRRYGSTLRIEHWDHAIASGEAAARRLLEGPGVDPFDPTPWFWSDQYDTKVQLVGLVGPDAEVVAGSLDEDRFAVVYGRDGVVSGVLGVNRPRHVAMMRTRVADGEPFADVVDAVAAL